MGVLTLARELFTESRIAIRAFRRQPTFFAAGVLTLALALGATIALISIADAVAAPRFRTFVLSAFGLCGLVLACVGAYGVAAFAAVRRKREIGIRVALGADPSSVVRLVVQDAMIRLRRSEALLVRCSRSWSRGRSPACSLMANRSIWSLSAICAGVLLLCTAVASWLPARRSA